MLKAERFADAADARAHDAERRAEVAKQSPNVIVSSYLSWQGKPQLGRLPQFGRLLGDGKETGQVHRIEVLGRARKATSRQSISCGCSFTWFFFYF